MKSVMLPLALLWLAAHAALLAVILSLKFLTAKMMMLALFLGAGLWFLAGRMRRPSLLPPPGMI